jgi:hypothetical protein
VATGGRQRGTRDERERARVYQARRSFHEGQSRRRTRDNLVAGIGGGILILAVIAGQTAYFLAGPGAPSPEPTSSSTPAPSVSPSPTTDDTETPLPTPAPSTSQ